MIEDQEITFNEKCYIWRYDADILSPHDCWSWTDPNFMSPPKKIVNQLNKTFISECATNIITNINSEDKCIRFFKILKAMGATSNDFVEAFVHIGQANWIHISQILQPDYHDNSNSQFAPTVSAKGWQRQSPLKMLGYKVGKDGITPSERRKILRQAMEEELPECGPDYYREQWGEPKSVKRLQKIANSLASHCRNRRGRPGAEEAISDWEVDLQWLKETYYREDLRFPWPLTYL